MSSSDFTPLVETHHRRRVAFDPTINRGHVLTFVGFLITGFSAYSALDKRVTLIESQSATGVERTREQDGRLQDNPAGTKGGDKIDIEAIEARLGRPLAHEQQDYSLEPGGVALLRLSGVMSPKANLFMRVSGGIST